jgi:high-affinity nickel-transport protein
MFGLGPVPAVRQALDRAGWKTADIQRIEINEAFAAIAIAVTKDLGLSSDVVNVEGGAIAHGHPIGATGGRGLIARIFRPVFSVVSRSWHMYPIGFLFGLGFNTATEIGLLGISATQAAQGMSFWTILVFPALFTAGMSFMDTTDSMLMTGAYGWAFVNPIRKLWYNLTITAASVVVAFFIGGIEALGLIGDKLGLKGGFWGVVGALNDNLANVGFAVVGIFIASWIVSALVYRMKGFDKLPVGQT